MKKIIEFMKFKKIKEGGIAFKIIFWVAMLGVVSDVVLILGAFVTGLGHTDGWTQFVIGAIFLPINWIMAGGLARLAWPQYFKEEVKTRSRYE